MPPPLRNATTRWLVRFGYDGVAFHGWARQPGLRTVEGEILGGLVRRGIVDAVGTASLNVASRPDRGVSATGTALTLTSPRAGPVLLRCLNGLSSELFFTAATPVPEEFPVRSARRRVYRYFEPAASHDLERWQATARLFVGLLDVRSLGRGLSSAAPVERTVESVRVERIGAVLCVELRAPSFVWGMVRKIVAALREVDAGRLASARLAAALAGRERLTLPLAEPEPLVLWNVEYGLPWEHRWTGPNRRQARRARELRTALLARAEMLGALAEAAGPTPAAP